MRAYYFDNLPEDQRLPHESERSVDDTDLRKIGVLHWTIPLDQGTPGWESEIDRIAAQQGPQGYKNRDTIDVTKEGLGNQYEAKIKLFSEEHMHVDDEIRYVLSGSGFFDVRDHPSEEWIRIQVLPGDLLVIPAGIYHRFILDQSNQIKLLRLFKEEPKWISYARSSETESNAHRIQYIDSLQATAVV